MRESLVVRQREPDEAGHTWVRTQWNLPLTRKRVPALSVVLIQLLQWVSSRLATPRITWRQGLIKKP